MVHSHRRVGGRGHAEADRLGMAFLPVVSFSMIFFLFRVRPHSSSQSLRTRRVRFNLRRDDPQRLLPDELSPHLDLCRRILSALRPSGDLCVGAGVTAEPGRFVLRSNRLWHRLELPSGRCTERTQRTYREDCDERAQALGVLDRLRGRDLDPLEDLRGHTRDGSLPRRRRSISSGFNPATGRRQGTGDPDTVRRV